MMEGWKEYKLGEIVDLKQGFALNKKSNHYLAKDNIGLPLLKISDLKNGTETLFVKENIPKQFIVTPSEIIYSRTGQVGLAFMGKTGVVYNNCFKVIPKEMVYSVFLYQWLNTSFVRTTISSLATGSAQPDLNHGAFKCVKINLPPLKTQRKIASILSGYDDLIENNLKRIKLLEEQAQQTYEEWFVRFKFPGHENVEMDEESGLPVGWEKVKLGDLAKVKGGKRLPKGHSLIDVKTNHPYIRVKDLTNGSVDLTSLVYINEQTHLSIKRYIISKDDIYISIAGTVGLVGIVPPIISNANLTENCAKITELENDFLQDYIYLFLQSTKGQYHIEARTGGASQPKLALYRVAAIPIILPTKMILEQFSLYSKKIRFSINNLQTQNQYLKEARDILLPRLMSGMIDVNKINLETLDHADI